MPEDKGLKYDQAIVELAHKHIHNHTCQILSKGGAFGYEPYGSGVLVKIDQLYFIFSASHVLEKMEQEDLYINTPEGIKPIQGAVELTDLTKHDNIDVAYVLLDPKFGDLLEKKYKFLPKDLLRKKYDDSGSVYLTMGYPVVNIKDDPATKTIRTGSSFVIHPLAKDKVYEYYKYSRELHYVLQYAGKGTDLKTNQKKKINKAPHGMSGGGLWHITFFEDENSSLILEYNLIGIVFEKQQKHFVHVANHIEILLDGIHQKIPIVKL